MERGQGVFSFCGAARHSTVAIARRRVGVGAAAGDITASASRALAMASHRKKRFASASGRRKPGFDTATVGHQE